MFKSKYTYENLAERFMDGKLTPEQLIDFAKLLPDIITITQANELIKERQGDTSPKEEVY